MNDQYATDIDSFIEQAAGQEAPRTDTRSAEQPEYEQESDYDDTTEGLARIYARATADVRETRAAHDTQLDRDIKRIQETGVCCDDGTHFDERGVLEVIKEMLDRGEPYDIDRAWKAWHERTLSWDARAKARKPTDPKVDKQSEFEKVEAIDDIAALKRKYAVQRKPHGGRTEDHPRLDDFLDRALGPVRGNALPNDR